MIIEELKIGNYMFSGLLNTGIELIPIDGEFSIEWNVDVPVVIVDVIFDSDKDTPLGDDNDLINLVEEEIYKYGDRLKWADDYAEALESRYWE